MTYVGRTNKKKYATLAEGFAARAADEQKKLDLYDEIAQRLGEKHSGSTVRPSPSDQQPPCEKEG